MPGASDERASEARHQRVADARSCASSRRLARLAAADPLRLLPPDPLTRLAALGAPVAALLDVAPFERLREAMAGPAGCTARQCRTRTAATTLRPRCRAHEACGIVRDSTIWSTGVGPGCADGGTAGHVATTNGASVVHTAAAGARVSIDDDACRATSGVAPRQRRARLADAVDRSGDGTPEYGKRRLDCAIQCARDQPTPGA